MIPRRHWPARIARSRRAVAGTALFLAGCATQPHEIPAAYVSTLQYADFTCRQIGQETDRVSRRANELYHSLKKTASNDSTQMAVGMILFWPTLFFLEGGDGPEAQEYARLKGELEALQKAAIEKDCRLPPPVLPESQPEQAPAIRNDM